MSYSMRYDQPVGSATERDAAQVWAGAWFDASGFGAASGTYKQLTGDWHTGADLNLPNYADSNAPVRASADGEVVYVGLCAGWQKTTVVVKHADGMWTRYAHLTSARVSIGQRVQRGDILALIGDYTPLNSGSGDHLHFDVARIDLGAKPGDWPGADLARLLRDYVDPREWINAHRTEDLPPMPTKKWTPTSSDGTRVRFTPDTISTTNIAGVIPGAAVVDGTLSNDGKWVMVDIKPERMTVSGVVLAPSVNATFAGFASSQFMKPAAITPPVPPVSGSAIGVHPALPALAFNKRTGVHTLERIEEAREAFDLGCRSFTIMNNHAGAREMRTRGAAVIVRIFMPHGVVVPPEEFARYYGVNADDTLICMGTNEADNISTSEIETRFDWDRRWANEMHRLYPKCFIVIGSFSMGTPQLDDINVAARFRNTYGAFLNANADWCGINYHSYHRRHSDKLPPFTHPVESPDWWPKRFLNWGYNAQHGGLSSRVVCVSDEAGVDIGGIGGFPACGYNDDAFLGWWGLQRSWFADVPQVYTQNVFQLSPRADWAGYNARCVLGGMARVWQGPA